MDLPVLAGMVSDAGDARAMLPSRRARFLQDIQAVVPRMIARAPELDRTARFPAADIGDLAECGALLAPLPAAYGGLGLGTEPNEAAGTAQFLRSLGYAHVAVGRLMEAHINAARLLHEYAEPALLRRAAADAADGRLIAVWVTDAPGVVLRVRKDGQLHGGKAFCSGAGAVSRAIVTCQSTDGTVRMAYVDVEDAPVTPLPASLQGVRAAITGQVDLTGRAVAPGCWLGAPGDYLREPLFSAGAWRTSAVTAGCLARLVDVMLADLKRRGRAEAPAQQARIGRAWIARETALHWISHVAAIAEDPAARPSEEIVAQVNLARIAIEACCVEALALAERSLGLQAFLSGTEIERIRRDLGTYLRQPALDEILAQAASHVVRTRVCIT
jgi:alkylation response protein AidB-like acyl-CoA dehydrogenase